MTGAHHTAASGRDDGERSTPSYRRSPGLHLWAALALLLVAVPHRLSAALQFDVFLGYDGIVREGGWFPVACEVYNDGASFTGTFELVPTQLGGGQARRMTIELPSGTRKRFTVPVFGSVGRYSSWDARLLDERGKMRGERLGLKPKDLVWEGNLLGAVARSFGGAPVFPETKQQGRPELKPQVARMQVEVFPDNPIALEGMDSLYLNTEKALELKAPQYNAILAWLHAGGHLIVGLEQAGDVGGLLWLKPMLPVDLRQASNIAVAGELQEWLRNTQDRKGALRSNRTVNAPRPGQSFRSVPAPESNPYGSLAPDEVFEKAELAVTTGTVREGQVMCWVRDVPLVVSVKRGRGQLTLLLFSPEREPFRSWKHRPWFWARLAQVPAALLQEADLNLYGGWSSDGIFGAMIDSRQVRKLPVEWLILLLVVYLLVIGPFDQWWLKKINRQMLTWITFPAYVVLFSVLIYFIGYKLRAGETEWNELHVVDVIRNGDHAELRGRSFLSMYSPVNANYKLASEQKVATLRSEFQGLWGGGQESARASVEQRPAGFTAEISVPVWTSQLFVSDWWQSGEMPLQASITPQGMNWLVTLENRLDRPIHGLRLVLNERYYELPDVPAGQSSTVVVEASQSKNLTEFVQSKTGSYTTIVQERQRALGDASRGRLEAEPENAISASFLGQLTQGNPNQRQFIYPAGLDLSPLVRRGDAVLLAWVPDYAAAKSFRQFSTLRSHQQSLYRIVIPIGPLPAL